MVAKAKVLVMGATGQVGGALLVLLKDKPEVEVLPFVTSVCFCEKPSVFVAFVIFPYCELKL